MKSKIKNIIILLLTIEIIITIMTGIYVRHGIKMKPQKYENIYLNYVAVEEFDINQAIQELKKLYNTPHIYTEHKLDDAYGEAIPMFRVIIIDKGLKQNCEQMYILTYAHELTHIKYMTINETYTEYKSIITLYESGIEYFKQIAWNEAVNIMRGYQSGSAYDCGAQLREYFGV